MKVLLVESDNDIVVSLVKRLTTHHVVVDVVNGTEDGWTYGSTFGYDLIIIGGQSHGDDSIDLCRRFRDEGLTLPILLLLSEDAQVTPVQVLDTGADDCVISPFDLEELHARIRALLRRGRANPFPVLVWGDLMLNSSTCEVTYREQPILLTAKEYGLLELFLRDTQHVFSIEEILESLWSSEEFPSEATVRSHLRRLRRKLQEAGAASDFIATVHGRGYYIKASAGETHTASHRADISDEDNAISPDHFLSPSIDSTTATEQYSARRLPSEWVTEWGASAPDHQALTEAPVLLVISRDEQDAQALAHLASNEGVRVAIALSLEQAKPWLVPSSMYPHPDAILIRTPVTLETVHVSGSLASASDRAETSAATTSQTSTELERTLDTLRLMGSHYLNLPIAVMSETATWRDRLMATRHGCTLFLAEPIAPELAIAALLPLLQIRSPATKVLALDSDPAWLQAMLTLLTPWGFEIITLDDVEPLMTILEGIHPDVVILEVNLPTPTHSLAPTGIEICRLLRTDPKWRHLPIIFLSEATDPALKDQAFLAGADDYLTKPIQGKELAERILSRQRRLQFSAARRHS